MLASSWPSPLVQWLVAAGHGFCGSLMAKGPQQAVGSSVLAPMLKSSPVAGGLRTALEAAQAFAGSVMHSSGLSLSLVATLHVEMLHYL